jgi:hypothetical protein
MAAICLAFWSFSGNPSLSPGYSAPERMHADGAQGTAMQGSIQKLPCRHPRIRRDPPSEREAHLQWTKTN